MDREVTARGSRLAGRSAALAAIVAALAVALVAVVALDRGPPPAARSAPDFELESLDGRIVRLADLRGRVLLLSFWATWCAPCKVETPWLIELDRRYRAGGLTIIGIAMDDGERETIARSAREQAVTYAVVVGDAAVARAYGGVRLLPHTVLIGRAGELLSSRAGLLGRTELEHAVRQALARGDPGG